LAGKRGGIDLHFTEEERTILKKLARSSIEAVLLRKKKEAIDVPQSLKRKMGAFVCLKTKGELKGCIGHLRGVMPLDETVKEMACQAAFHDPRFLPLNAIEWEDTEIEISVLTPMERIKDINEIRVGIHGIYLEKGAYAGLLLPQVAVEHGWDELTFLEATCAKAGLPKDGWKSKDTKIYIFSADVF
jgi:AmmeMemoRadiSam system protein A